MDQIRILLTFTAGLLSFINLSVCAYGMHTGKVPTNNTSTWIMWVVLDILILICTIAADQSPWLAWSYVLGASFILFMHFKKGKWKWTWVEGLSITVTVAATIWWQLTSAEEGVVATVIAMNTAGIPAAYDMWRKPARPAFWLFANTAIACLLMQLGTETPWTFANSALAVGGFVFNTTVALFTLRKTAEQRAWEAIPISGYYVS